MRGIILETKERKDVRHIFLKPSSIIILILIIIGGSILWYYHEVTFHEGKGMTDLRNFYIISYEHSGVILWGLKNFEDWNSKYETPLDKYPWYKTGLQTEAYTFDQLAEAPWIQNLKKWALEKEEFKTKILHKFNLSEENYKRLVTLAFQGDPAYLKKIKDWIQNKYKGRYGLVDGCYSTSYLQYVCNEGNIRNFYYGKTTTKQHLGYNITVYMCQEHRWHTQLPQILKKMGYNLAILRTHWRFCGWCPELTESIVEWEGPDGTRLAAIPQYVGGNKRFQTTPIGQLHRIIKNQGIKAAVKWWLGTIEEDYKRYNWTKLPAFLWSVTPETGIGHFLPEALMEIKEKGLRGEGEGKYPFRFTFLLAEEIPEVFGRPTSIFRPDPNEFLYLIGWGAWGNDPWSLPREAEISVLTAERVAALNSLLGGDTFEEKLDTAWKALLASQHHDYVTCGRRELAEILSGYSLEVSKNVTKNSLSNLFSRVDARNGDKSVLIFNPLAMERREIVWLDLNFMKGEAYYFSLFDGNVEIPYQVIREERYGDNSIKTSKIVFYCDLPSLGYKVITIKYTEPTIKPVGMDVNVASKKISTKYYDIIFSDDGGISRIFDKILRLDLVRRDGLNGKFRAKVDGEEKISSGEVNFEVVGPLVTIVKEQGSIGSIPYQNRIIIYNDLRRIDFETTFTFNGQRIGEVGVREGATWLDDHKLGVIFQLNTDNVTVYSDRPFLIHKAARYEGIYPWAQTPLEQVAFYGLTWADVSSPQCGLALFNTGTMGYRAHNGSLFMVLAQSGPVPFWGNIRLKGNYTYRYALYPHPGDWMEGDVPKEADRYNFKVLTYVGDPHPGDYPRQLSLLKLIADNILVSAVYTRNGSLFVRMYEYQGRNSSIILTSPDFQFDLERVNLMHEEAKPLTLPIPIEKHEIITLKVSAKFKAKNSSVINRE